jgi:hypothetical protein
VWRGLGGGLIIGLWKRTIEPLLSGLVTVALRPRGFVTAALMAVALFAVPIAAAQTTVVLHQSPTPRPTKTVRPSPTPRPSTTVSVPDPIRTDDQKDLLDKAAAASQLLAALVAVLGLPFIAAQLLFGRHEARMQHTAELLSRWEARELRAIQSRVAAFLEVANVTECIERLRAWEGMTYSEAEALPRSGGTSAPRASRNDVDQIRNFFEDVAIRYNEGEIVREPVVASIGYAAVVELVKSLWLTHYERDGLSGSEYPLYREWEVMVAELRRGPDLNPPLPWKKPTRTTREAIQYLKALKPKLLTGVICLPRGDDDAAWSLAARISTLLGNQSILEEIGATPTDSSGTQDAGWRVWILPRQLELTSAQAAEDRLRAASVRSWLNDKTLVQLDAAIATLEQRS